jgi:hypothetical protein
MPDKRLLPSRDATVKDDVSPYVTFGVREALFYRIQKRPDGYPASVRHDNEPQRRGLNLLGRC